jgi:hypothetical protein
MIASGPLSAAHSLVLTRSCSVQNRPPHILLLIGMPTSVLVDGAGCEVGTIAGPAEWASEDAFKLIKAATAK